MFLLTVMPTAYYNIFICHVKRFSGTGNSTGFSSHPYPSSFTLCNRPIRLTYVVDVAQRVVFGNMPRADNAGMTASFFFPLS